MDFADNVWDVDWGPRGEFEEAAAAAGFSGGRGGRLERQGGRGLRAPGRGAEPGRGPEGGHQLSNRSDAPARYVPAASQGSPEIIEYPDSGKIAAMSRTETSAGGPLFTIHRLADGVDYFDGESNEPD